MPPAFALSQDQTLRFISTVRLPEPPRRTDPTHLGLGFSPRGVRAGSKRNCSRICRRYAASFPERATTSGPFDPIARTPQATSPKRGRRRRQRIPSIRIHMSTNNTEPPAFPCGSTAGPAPTAALSGGSVTLMKPRRAFKQFVASVAVSAHLVLPPAAVNPPFPHARWCLAPGRSGRGEDGSPAPCGRR